MRGIHYECRSCGKRLTPSEREWFDDPMAPFGPEYLCPDCHGGLTPKYHPLLIGIVTMLGLAIGLLAGYALRSL